MMICCKNLTCSTQRTRVNIFVVSLMHQSHFISELFFVGVSMATSDVGCGKVMTEDLGNEVECFRTCGLGPYTIETRICPSPLGSRQTRFTSLLCLHR